MSDTVYLTLETLASVVGGTRVRADRLNHPVARKVSTKLTTKLPRKISKLQRYRGVGRSSGGGIGSGSW